MGATTARADAGHATLILGPAWLVLLPTDGASDDQRRMRREFFRGLRKLSPLTGKATAGDVANFVRAVRFERDYVVETAVTRFKSDPAVRAVGNRVLNRKEVVGGDRPTHSETACFPVVAGCKSNEPTIFRILH